MPQVVDLTERPERREVEIQGLDGCSITVREPTARERIEQWLYAGEASPQRSAAGDLRNAPLFNAALWEYRLRVVVDWKGFVDKTGELIPFSARSFNAAIAQVEVLQNVAVRAANAAFRGVGEAEAKNSDAPSADGG